jgi:hypothetical protein
LFKLILIFIFLVDVKHGEEEIKIKDEIKRNG